MGLIDRWRKWRRKHIALSTMEYHDNYLQYDVLKELETLLNFELYIRGLDEEGYIADILEWDSYQHAVGIGRGYRERDYKTGKLKKYPILSDRDYALHFFPKYGNQEEVMKDIARTLIKGGRGEELYSLAEKLKSYEREVEKEPVRREIIKLLGPYIEQRAKKEFNEFLDKYLMEKEQEREKERFKLLRKEKTEVKYEERCGHCYAPIKLQDFRKGECGYCNHAVRGRIRKKVEEAEPVTPKLAISVILVLCLIFGIGFLGTERLATGYTVFAYNSANWSAVILLLISLILALYLVKKR